MEGNRTQALAREGIVTRSQLAYELGFSEQLIALWEKDGMPVIKIKMKRLYDAKKVASWIKSEGKKK